MIHFFILLQYLFCFFLTNFKWSISSFYFLVYFIYFSVLYKYRKLFLSVFDRNASYLFDYYFFLYLYFISLNYFLIASLLSWIISKLFCKLSIKSYEYIPKVFTCKKYHFHLNIKKYLQNYQLSLYFWVHLICSKLFHIE